MRKRLSAVVAGCGVAALAALGTGVGAASAAVANPATALAFASKGCIPQGAGVVECVANVTGGTAPYVYHWSNDPGVNSSDIAARCDVGHVNTITLTVTDAAGGQISSPLSFNCLGGPPR